MTNLLNFGLIFQDMHIFRLFMLSRYDWFILILVVIVLQHCCNKKKKYCNTHQWVLLIPESRQKSAWCVNHRRRQFSIRSWSHEGNAKENQDFGSHQNQLSDLHHTELKRKNKITRMLLLLEFDKVNHYFSHLMFLFFTLRRKKTIII